MHAETPLRRYLPAFFFAILVCCAPGPVLAAAPAEAAPAEPGPGRWLIEMRGLRLEPERAVAVGRLTLQLGSAKLRIEEGVFVPASAVAGRVVELIFLGRAAVELEPPDEIEKGQLELFTRTPRLAEKISQAVLVIAADGPAAAILGRSPSALQPAQLAAAQQLYAGWLGGPERKLLNVDQALLQDAAGDAAFQGYFAGLFQGDQLGRFVYQVDPSEHEQNSLGQFVPLPLTRRQQRRLDRELQRQQRRGRLIGLESDDVGSWDSWLSASQGEKGQPRPGHPGFEPRHYELEAAFSSGDLALRGRARLRLETLLGGCRAVRLRLHSDLEVSAVRLAGAPLFYHQHGGEVLVLLRESPALGEELVIEVDYSGDLLDKVKRGYFELRDSLAWYPHAGETDRATYEATFRWPKSLQLLTGGQPAGGGTEGGERWEKRSYGLPTLGIGFELGRFEISERQVGHVLVRLGMPPIELGGDGQESNERILGAVAESLTYFEEIFGPYPLDRLEVALTPRLYSQSLLGFLSLSSLMMADHDLLTVLFGLEDPRTVVAHEVAHQWWGHKVGWESYRDVWLSESLANYSALLFARNKLAGDLRFALGPTKGWENALLAEAGDGRPIEAAGPLALGTRLDSSKADAYAAIVYKKGAVVLSTLAQFYGEEDLIRMLKAVADVAAHRPVSTATFLALLEKASGSTLEAFGRQFVYGTGLPEIHYDYRISRLESGKWRVDGVARQASRLLFRYRAEKLPEGSFAVLREKVELLDAGRSRLVLPLEIDLFDPQAPLPAPAPAPAKAKTKDKDEDAPAAPDPREVGNRRMRGRLLVEGAEAAIELELEHEPKTVWLNREKLVYARAFNDVLYPKRALQYRALVAAAEGRAGEAADLLRQALAAKGYDGPAYADRLDADAQAADDRHVDGATLLQLARLALEAGDPATAREHLDRAAKLLETPFGQLFQRDSQVLEARLALAGGRPAKAFDLLDKRVLGKDAGGPDAEAALLVAIAAHAAGRPEDARRAVEAARQAGADVAALLAGGVGGARPAVR